MSSRAADKQAARAARIATEERARAQAARTRRLRMLAIAAAAAAVVVVGAIAISGGTKHPASRAPDTAQTASLFAGIPQHGVVLGDPKAKGTIIEFADLQCPYCKDFADAALPTVIDRYVRTGRAKLVFRTLAFLGPDSVRAQQVAAGAAQQNRLWPFIDRFYAQQQTENSGYVTDAFLRQVGSQVAGLDVGRAFVAGGTGAGAAALRAARADQVRYGVKGTPSLVVDGKLVSSITPPYAPADVTTAIDQALGA